MLLNVSVNQDYLYYSLNEMLVHFRVTPSIIHPGQAIPAFAGLLAPRAAR